MRVLSYARQVTRQTSHLDASIEPVAENEKIGNGEKVPIQEIESDVRQKKFKKKQWTNANPEHSSIRCN